MDALLPPAGPPPLLGHADVQHLCTHGYCALALPAHLDAKFKQLKDAADAFFALPAAKKETYTSGRGNTERGYSAVEHEKEFLTLRKSMTHLPPGLDDKAEPLWHDTARLLHRILGDLGVALGMPAGTRAWDAVISDSLDPVKQNHPRDDPPTLLRLFRYERGGGGAESHRDLGLLTVCVCWGRGLQVKKHDAWTDAPRVTVMAGNELSVLSGHRVRSALHRVVVDTAATAADRRSIVFALRATTRGALDLRPLGLADETSPDGFAVDAAAFYQTIRRNRVNINADKHTRDAMRARQRSLWRPASLALWGTI